MEVTKYNLSITTSGENGDHASTNISTSNPAQLADILQLAGMQGGHPVALSAPEAPAHEEHGSCDVCGGMHEGDEHVAEGDSWDNEPNGATEVVYSPEEITQTGNDLHKVKKTYPKVNGGDNPMALEEAEGKLREKWENFLAEDMEEEITEDVELVSPWKKQDTSIEIVEEEELDEEEVEEAAGKMKKKKPCPEEKIIENKNMNDIRKLVDSIDSINGDGSTVVTEATTAELQAQIAALKKQLAAQQANEPDPWSPEGQAAMAARQQARASKEGGRESGPAGSFTDADYDDDGNFIGTPLNVFGKAEKHSGRESGPTGSHTADDYELDADGNVDYTKLKPGREIKVFGKAEKQVGRENSGGGAPSGPYNPRTPGIRARAEGLQARMAAAREAGYPSLKAARAGGHPSGSEHTWTGSGAFEVGGPNDPNRAGAGDGEDGYAITTALPPGPEVVGTPIGDGDKEIAPEVLGQIMREPKWTDQPAGDDSSTDSQLKDIVKLSGGSWSAEQQAAMARRQAERSARERGQGGGRESGPAGSYTDDDYDDDGNLIRKPLKVFKKPEPRYGPGDSNNPKYGSGKKVGGRTGAEMGGGPGHVDPVFTRPIKSKGREGGREN